MPQVITLLTDFGYRDGFVGAMKGVICGINPHAQIIDVCHDITPGDINSAAFVIAQTAPYFPQKSVHLIVVDPGVGSTRKPLVVQSESACFVAPDNGVLKFIFEKEMCKVYEISNKDFVYSNRSSTFHGRDVFAPVAAHLSKGVPIEEIGTLISDYQRGHVVKPVIKKDELLGEIIYIDRFGNLVTNILKDQTKSVNTITIKNVEIKTTSKCYSSVKQYELAALIGSHNYLEIAQRDGNAQQKLGCGVGEKVILKR